MKTDNAILYYMFHEKSLEHVIRIDTNDIVFIKFPYFLPYTKIFNRHVRFFFC